MGYAKALASQLGDLQLQMGDERLMGSSLTGAAA